MSLLDPGSIQHYYQEHFGPNPNLQYPSCKDRQHITDLVYLPALPLTQQDCGGTDLNMEPSSLFALLQ